jgi:hypothetical protein
VIVSKPGFCQARTNTTPHFCMIIPVTLKSARSNATHLPPQLARLGSDEVVLIELQGSLTVETNEVEDRDGQAVGTLHIDEARPSVPYV